MPELPFSHAQIQMMTANFAWLGMHILENMGIGAALKKLF
jgi:hypothetical protein